MEKEELEKLGLRLYTDLEKNEELLKHMVRSICQREFNDVKLVSYDTFTTFDRSYIAINLILDGDKVVISIDCH